ncbi:unnamed protein product [Caenorhabditis auriculariae]|uniref:Uncharacterized protein n=1 Tax=Caenorhabditis auriculariae TaxID=2777116 RepID=A0A8S1H768_9PELO|nr:unnamed protein product [Caenorhabditis auriculariae]
MGNCCSICRKKKKKEEIPEYKTVESYALPSIRVCLPEMTKSQEKKNKKKKVVEEHPYIFHFCPAIPEAKRDLPKIEVYTQYKSREAALKDKEAKKERNKRMMGAIEIEEKVDPQTEDKLPDTIEVGDQLHNNTLSIYLQGQFTFIHNILRNPIKITKHGKLIGHIQLHKYKKLLPTYEDDEKSQKELEATTSKKLKVKNWKPELKVGNLQSGRYLDHKIWLTFIPKPRPGMD